MGNGLALLLALILIALPHCRSAGRSQGDLRWGEWDSVSCYACGLASVDPERDEEGLYGIAPGEGKKMYNHSCDLMDNGIQGNYEFAGQELDPRSNYDVVWETKTYQNCTMVEVVSDNGTVTYEEECVDALTTLCPEPVTTAIPTDLGGAGGNGTDGNGTTTTTSTTTTTTSTTEGCKNVPHTYEVSKKVRRPPKAYDVDMWLRRCPRGVRSCFKAQGNWDDQKPIFRGCAGAKYEHGTKCKRELQRVKFTPGKPRVDVEVYLCYCTGDECNKEDITAGTDRLNASIFFLTFFLLMVKTKYDNVV